MSYSFPLDQLKPPSLQGGQPLSAPLHFPTDSDTTSNRGDPSAPARDIAPSQSDTDTVLFYRVGIELIPVLGVFPGEQSLGRP